MLQAPATRGARKGQPSKPNDALRSSARNSSGVGCARMCGRAAVGLGGKGLDVQMPMAWHGDARLACGIEWSLNGRSVANKGAPGSFVKSEGRTERLRFSTSADALRLPRNGRPCFFGLLTDACESRADGAYGKGSLGCQASRPPTTPAKRRTRGSREQTARTRRE
eukprot:scaffold1724_cov246-Pinguiococcus_pyrenoidosus.AAC.19